MTRRLPRRARPTIGNDARAGRRPAAGLIEKTMANHRQTPAVHNGNRNTDSDNWAAKQSAVYRAQGGRTRKRSTVALVLAGGGSAGAVYEVGSLRATTAVLAGRPTNARA